MLTAPILAIQSQTSHHQLKEHLEICTNINLHHTSFKSYSEDNVIAHCSWRLCYSVLLYTNRGWLVSKMKGHSLTCWWFSRSLTILDYEIWLHLKNTWCSYVSFFSCHGKVDVYPVTLQSLTSEHVCPHSVCLGCSLPSHCFFPFGFI
jgi:hypothetical protein